MAPKLIPAKEKELTAWPESTAPFAAWLHFVRPWEPDDEKWVSHMIKSGCRFIMITGLQSEEVNDHIDWIVSDITKDTVLTLRYDKIDEEAVFNFLSTRCPGGSTSYSVVSVIGESKNSDFSSSEDVIRAIKLGDDDGSSSRIVH